MNEKPPAEPAAPSRAVIYLLRHGAVESRAGARRYIGQQDLALSEAGLRQAAAWAEYFALAAPERICCSDLRRCLQTARIIADRCNLAPQAFSELREIHLGAWDGRRFETVKALYPSEFRLRGERPADHRPPGGESFRDLQKRAWPCFETLIRRPGGKTLIVTHAGVIRVLLCSLLGMPLDNLFRIDQAYGALNIVSLEGERYRLQALNLQPPG